MASQFHSGIDDLANEAELSDLRKEVVNLDEKKIITQEMKNLKETNEKLNYEIDKLTEKRTFVIYKSNKKYFVKHNEIYDRDDQKIGEFQ